MGKNDKFGLVLGGGAARGYAHIGVLRYLIEQNRIPSEMAGASMGALIGALFSMGKTPDEMLRIAAEENLFPHIFDLSFSTGGILSGKKLDLFLEKTFGETTFEELRIPLAINATDIETGEEVVFRSGLIKTAIRASISVPTIFTPIEVNGQILVDGGLSANVPSHLITQPQSLVVNVRRPIRDSLLIREAMNGKKTKPIPTLREIVEQTFSIFFSRTDGESINSKEGRTVLQLNLHGFRYSDFTKYREIAETGYRETQEILKDW